MTGVTVSNCSEQVPKEWESKGRCLKSSNWSPRCVAVQVFLGLQTLRFMEPAACFEDMPRYAPICSLIPTPSTHTSSCLWVEKNCFCCGVHHLQLILKDEAAVTAVVGPLVLSCPIMSYPFPFLLDLGRLQCTSAIGPAVESRGWDLHGISGHVRWSEATRLRCCCPLRGGLCHWIWSGCCLRCLQYFFWNPDIFRLFRLSLFVEDDLYFLMVLMVC